MIIVPIAMKMNGLWDSRELLERDSAHVLNNDAFMVLKAVELGFVNSLFEI